MNIHLSELRRLGETDFQVCKRVSMELKRILTVPEIEEIIECNRNVSQAVRNEVIKACPDLPKCERGVKKHDMEHENFGYKKRKCIGPGADGLGCKRIFVSEGHHNRICPECKDNTFFHSSAESVSFGRKI